MGRKKTDASLLCRSLSISRSGIYNCGEQKYRRWMSLTNNLFNCKHFAVGRSVCSCSRLRYFCLIALAIVIITPIFLASIVVIWRCFDDNYRLCYLATDRNKTEVAVADSLRSNRQGRTHSRPAPLKTSAGAVKIMTTTVHTTTAGRKHKRPRMLFGNLAEERATYPPPGPVGTPWSL